MIQLSKPKVLRSGSNTVRMAARHLATPLTAEEMSQVSGGGGKDILKGDGSGRYTDCSSRVCKDQTFDV